MRKKFLLGLLTMALPLTMWAQSDPTFKVAIDGADDDGNITYNGDLTKPTISVKDNAGVNAATEGQYNITYYAVGSTETPIPPSGVRNVGDYKIVVSGKTGNDYFNYKDTEVKFKVLPKSVSDALTLQMTGVSKSYGENDSVLLQQLVTTIPNGVLAPNTNATAERADFLACLKVARYDVNEANPEGTGPHKVIVVGDEEATSNYKYDAPDNGNYVTITINPAVLTVTTTGKPYDGVAVENVDTIKRTFTGKVGSEDVSVKLSYTKGEIKNAGIYQIHVDLEGNDKDNYTVDTLVAYTITKLPLTIEKKTSATLSEDYAGARDSIDVTEKFDFKGLLQGETKEGLDLHLFAAVDGGEVKTGYPIALYQGANKVTTLTNYDVRWASNYTYAITKNAFGDGKGFAIKIDNTKATYQGRNFVIPEGLITITYTHDNVTDTLQSSEYTLAIANATDTLMSAGSTFRVVATAAANGNFSGTMNSNLITITQKTLEITAKDNQTWEKPYDGVSGQIDLTDHFNINGFVTGESEDSIGLSMRKQYSDPKAQKYKVLPFNGTKVWSATNAFKNYTIAYPDTAIFTIKPAAATYYIKGDSVKYSGNNKYSASANAQTKAIPYEVVIEGLAEKDSVFTFATAPTVVFADTTITEAVNAGEYDLAVTNADKVKLTNYTLTYGGNNTPLVIEKADAHVTAPTLAPLAFGETLSVDTLAKMVKDYNLTKINNTDVPNGDDRTAIREIIELQLSDSASTYKSGTYTNGLMIVVKDPEDLDSAKLVTYNNFNIIPTHSTLIINGLGTLVLDGALDDLTDSLQANGATYEKIIVKNLRSRRDKGIKAEKWYTLVLPFEVTVRELSREFGYAIVNVPDLTNADPDVMKFKLTMQKVPANTMMAFKVDDEMDWEQLGDTIVFENKMIATPTGEWATDKAGNQYIGVYKETLTGGSANGDYWLHTDGEYYGNVETIYPLSGYVHFETPTSNARFIFENPDGSTTTISAVNVDAAKPTEGWYTVGGVKLNGEPTQKGIYINNGKKVVIK